MRHPPTIGFTLLLLCAVLLIFGLTLDLGRVAGLVPFYVVIPTLALLLIQLVFDCLPKLADKFGPYGQGHLKKTELIQEKPGDAMGSTRSDATLRHRELQALAWLLLLPLAVFLLGFLIGVPLYVAAYFKVRAQIRWVPALAAAVGSALLLYGLFDLGLDTSLYRGCIWPWLSGPSS